MLNIHSPIPTSFSHVTACSMVVLIYTVCHVLYQAAVELPSIPIVFIALVIKLELFMLQLTCEKDVGMGLCMFNFVILLSLYLVSMLFGTSIPTSFYIFGKCFFALVSVHFFLIK